MRSGERIVCGLPPRIDCLQCRSYVRAEIFCRKARGRKGGSGRRVGPVTDREKPHEPNEVDQRVATHDESKCPTRPRTGREINRHGALSGRGNYRRECRSVPQSWRRLAHAQLCHGEQLPRFVEGRDSRAEASKCWAELRPRARDGGAGPHFRPQDHPISPRSGELRAYSDPCITRLKRG